MKYFRVHSEDITWKAVTWLGWIVEKCIEISFD
jgi:hypothetical protein